MPYNRARASVDIAHFGRYCVPEYVCDEVPPFHARIFDALRPIDGSSAPRRVCLVAPRHHAKTTCLQIAILHRIAHLPTGEKDFIVCGCETQDQAVDFVGDIAGVIEDASGSFRKHYSWVQPSTELKPDYDFGGELLDPERNPRAKWGAYTIITSNGVKIIAVGAGQRIRGKKWRGIRPKLVALDDFESEHNSDTAEGRKKVTRWLRAVIFPMLAGGRGTAYLGGTVVHEMSFLNRTAARSMRKGSKKPGVRNQWKVLFYRAKHESGDLFGDDYGTDGMLWGVPHQDQDGEIVAFDEQWWDETRAEYQEDGELALFYQEYQNKISHEGSTFNHEIMRYYDQMKIDDGAVMVKRAPDSDWVQVTCFLGVDPATSEEAKADYCVLMPVGVDPDGNIYQLPFVREKFGKDAAVTANAIFSLHAQYDFKSVGIERVAAQVYLEGEVERQMRERGQWFELDTTLKTHLGKDKKVYSLQPRFKQGKLWLHPQSSAQLVEELTNYPRAAHDDLPDALWMACEVAWPMGGRRVVDIDEKRSGRPLWGRKTWKVA